MWAGGGESVGDGVVVSVGEDQVGRNGRSEKGWRGRDNCEVG
mgnify:CR=1 FL=1